MNDESNAPETPDEPGPLVDPKVLGLELATILASIESGDVPGKRADAGKLSSILMLTDGTGVQIVASNDLSPQDVAQLIGSVYRALRMAELQAEMARLAAGGI